MLHDSVDRRRPRLNLLAVALIGLRRHAAVVADAVRLAEDLVASGDDGPATVAVACLSRDTALSDAEPLLLSMLAEHNVRLPLVDDDQTEFELLRHAFAFWDLPLGEFEGAFYGRIPAWDEQDDLERNLVLRLDRLDHVTDPDERSTIEAEMRAATRAALEVDQSPSDSG